MYRLVIAIALVLVTACGKSTSKKLKPGATCIQATTNMLKVPLVTQGRDLAKLSDSKLQYLADVAMAIAEHCQSDAWSREAVECLAGAETVDDLGACKDTLTAVQGAAVSSATADVESGAFRRRRDEQARVRAADGEKARARAELEKDIAETRDRFTKLAAMIPAWHRANPNRKDCPMFASALRDETQTMANITAHTPNPFGPLNTGDPWLSQIQVRCGEDVPAGVGIGFIAAGPDLEMDTADDIKSW